MNTFNARSYANKIDADFDTADEAARVIEAAGSGEVVKFHLSPNFPGCLPEMVARSCALWAYDEGKWYAIDIFGGGRRFAEERPVDRFAV